jgi:hypothetical protein
MEKVVKIPAFFLESKDTVSKFDTVKRLYYILNLKKGQAAVTLPHKKSRACSH